MDKKIAALLGAAAALTSMSTANASTPAPATSSAVTSYGDLLNPIPNAMAQLVADDAARAADPSGQMKMAQIAVEVGGRHHHHHRYRRFRHHHHHQFRRQRHHHHHSQYMAIPKAKA